MGYGIVIPGPPRFVAGEAYTFGEMTGIIAERLGIGFADISQFTSRMRNLSRLGLCAHRKRGAGRAGLYSAYDALQYYVAMRLNLLGLYPETIVPLAEARCYSMPPKARSPMSIWLQPAFGGAASQLLLEIPDDILSAALAERYQASPAPTRVEVRS